MTTLTTGQTEEVGAGRWEVPNLSSWNLERTPDLWLHGAEFHSGRFRSRAIKGIYGSMELVHATDHTEPGTPQCAGGHKRQLAKDFFCCRVIINSSTKMNPALTERGLEASNYPTNTQCQHHPGSLEMGAKIEREVRVECIARVMSQLYTDLVCLQ